LEGVKILELLKVHFEKGKKTKIDFYKYKKSIEFFYTYQLLTQYWVVIRNRNKPLMVIGPILNIHDHGFQKIKDLVLVYNYNLFYFENNEIN
jgi:hypothetical protein